MSKWFYIMAVLGMAVLPLSPARAQTDDKIEGAKLCTRHMPRYEREHGIPTHLLSAIASTESGRYHKALKLMLPWPWTINVEGKGYYFDTKQEAISAVRKFRARGAASIDVGCMQVNLHHHPEAFASLEQAFDPERNVAYAASFLRNLYETDGSWKKAASAYHSKTPSRGREYVGMVYNSWFRIIDKLRAARLQVPETAVVAMNDLKSERQVAPAAEKQSTYAPPRMRTIKVSDSGTNKRDAVAVYPDYRAKDKDSREKILTMAQAAPHTRAVPVRIRERAAYAGGPNFIFRD